MRAQIATVASQERQAALARVRQAQEEEESDEDTDEEEEEEEVPNVMRSMNPFPITHQPTVTHTYFIIIFIFRRRSLWRRDAFRREREWLRRRREERKCKCKCRRDPASSLDQITNGAASCKWLMLNYIFRRSNQYSIWTVVLWLCIVHTLVDTLLFNVVCR